MNASETNSASDNIFRFMLQFVSPYFIHALLREIHEKNAHKISCAIFTVHSTRFFTEHFTQWLIRTNGLVSVQRRIQNPVKHLRWSFLQKNDWKDLWVGSEYVSAACQKSIKLTEIVNPDKIFLNVSQFEVRLESRFSKQVWVTIWDHLCNLEKVKSTHGGVSQK